MNFGWSLKPVFIWFAVTFGIDLDRSKKKSKVGRRWATFLCIFGFFGFNISINLMYMVQGSKEFTKSSSSKSFVYNVNAAISWIIPGILNILLLVTIVYSSFGKWKSLWERLQRLQDDIGENPIFHQLRQHTNQGLLIFFLVKAASSWYTLIVD